MESKIFLTLSCPFSAANTSASPIPGAPESSDFLIARSRSRIATHLSAELPDRCVLRLYRKGQGEKRAGGWFELVN